ncbi:MAG: hypothetical protein AAB425_08280 [Bdellovibrionota bacterium]
MVFAFVGNAQAADSNPCSQLTCDELRLMPEGFTCTTGAKEVWADMKSGFFWSSRLGKKLGQWESFKVCKSKLDQDAIDSRAGIDYAKFVILTLAKFQTAERHGFREVLADMNERWYWTQDIYGSAYPEGYGVAFAATDNHFLQLMGPYKPF